MEPAASVKPALKFAVPAPLKTILSKVPSVIAELNVRTPVEAEIVEVPTAEKVTVPLIVNVLAAAAIVIVLAAPV